MDMGASGAFRLLGFPLRVDPGLLIVLFVVATSVHSTRAVLGAFIVGGLVSVLAHELGHAVVARWLGASGVSISLHSWGGLTKYALPTANRGRTALIATAGPTVGLALGACVWFAEKAAAPMPGSEAHAVYGQLLFVTIGWSVLNLLPVVPLDGGRLMEQLLPGSAQDRARGAGVVSTLAGGLACLWFWQHAEWYAAILFGLLAGFGAVYAILGMAPGSTHRHTPSCAVFAKVCAGDHTGAVAAAQAMNKPDPALTALLQAILSDDRAAQARLYELNEQRPKDQMARSCLVILRSRQGDWPGVLAMLPGQNLKIGAIAVAFDAAYKGHAFTEAAALGEAMLRVRNNPTVAYNTACCWARAGNSDLALSALMRAVSHGWTDWAQVDSDEDLANVRMTPAFQSWRATLPVAA
jgi:Zn-dependent protease